MPGHVTISLPTWSVSVDEFQIEPTMPFQITFPKKEGQPPPPPPLTFMSSPLKVFPSLSHCEKNERDSHPPTSRQFYNKCPSHSILMTLYILPGRLINHPRMRPPPINTTPTPSPAFLFPPSTLPISDDHSIPSLHVSHLSLL